MKTILSLLSNSFQRRVFLNSE